MSNFFNPVQPLQKLAQSTSTGQLIISDNSVTWELQLIEGKLKFATNSLHNSETLQYYLLGMGCNFTVNFDSLITEEYSNHCQIMERQIDHLLEKKLLNESQKIALKKQLSLDALESLLWLTQATIYWQPQTQISPLDQQKATSESFLEISPLIATLQEKSKKWHQLASYITSPHQRPQCIKPQIFEQEMASRNQSLITLKKMVKLMRGISIRQLALLLKQDEVKVAQFLCPYLKNRILQLQPPKSPLSKLPLIPSSSSSPSLDELEQQKTSPLPTTVSNKPPEKRYKIVCIDDSPAILDIIQSYLIAEKYEIIPIDNPMKSMNYLFEKKPDLILMDISMPGINGNRLCQILKNSSVFQHTPVIMVSGNTKILNSEKIQEVGATDYLAKPFTKHSLQQMIDKYL